MKKIDKGFTSGIYQIVNIVNGKFYIGSSKNIEYRWKIEHTKQLEKGTHANIILQRAWVKYGADNFILEIIELIDKSRLLEREQYYLDVLQPEYNIGRNASGGDNLTDHPNRQDIIDRIRTATNKRIKDLGVDYWIEWGERYKGTGNPNYGNNWTDEQKEIQSAKLKEYYKTHDNYRTGKTNIELFGKDKAEKISEKISVFAKTRTGDKNPFYGKTHTNLFKQKRAKEMLGNKPTNSIKVQIDSVTYCSLAEAGRILNIPTPTIYYRINSKNVKFKDYKYIN